MAAGTTNNTEEDGAAEMAEGVAWAWPEGRPSLRGLLQACRRWLVANLAAEQGRWTLWLPVVFAFGIGWYFSLTEEPSPWVGPVAMAGAVVAVLVGLRKRGSVLVLGLAAFMVSGGFVASMVRTQMVAAPILGHRTGIAEIRGRVAGIEALPLDASRATLDRVWIKNVPAAETPTQIRIRLRPDIHPRPGDILSARAILSPPSPPAAPGSFDFGKQAYFNGIGAVGFVVGKVELRPPSAAEQVDWTDAVALALADQRQAISKRVREILPGPRGTIAIGLLTGDVGPIPPKLLNAMRDSGLAHLLAVSGMNIGLAAAILFVSLRSVLALIEPLALRYPIKKWAAAAALLSAYYYLVISGSTVPAQRSFISTGVILIGVLCDRTAMSMRLLAWAAMVVLVLEPESLLSASFQMSYGAVLGLIAVFETYWSRLKLWLGATSWVGKLVVYVTGVCLTTLVASTATAPYAIYHFNRYPVWSLPANLLADPIMCLWVMPLAVATFVLFPLGLESLALIPLGWGAEGIILIAEETASWPGAVAELPSMPVAAMVATTLGGVWLCLWRGKWRYLGVIPFVGGMLSLAFANPPDILVDGDGKVMAVRGEDRRLLISSGKLDGFLASSWQRRTGAVTMAHWPSGMESDPLLDCDSLGCALRIKGRSVALVRDALALEEDCHSAEIIIALVPVRREKCPSARVIVDRYDLWRNGGHALWVGKNSIRVENVAAERGHRPWVPQRPPRKKKAPKVEEE